MCLSEMCQRVASIIMRVLSLPQLRGLRNRNTETVHRSGSHKRTGSAYSPSTHAVAHCHGIRCGAAIARYSNIAISNITIAR